MIMLKFPWLPMSVNDLYMSIRKSKNGIPITLRTLTKEGRAWKRETLAYIVKSFQPQLAQFKNNVPYAAHYRFNTPKLKNSTWPGGADSRYKKFDATNLVKSIEDVVAEASGVDDSNYILTVCEKVQADQASTIIRFWNVEEEASPFYATALTL